MSRKIIGITVGTPINPQIAINKTEQAEQIAKNTQDISNLYDTKVTAPSIAEAGQLIAVKSVDEAGKPIEWECVGMPEVPEQTQADWDEYKSNKQSYIKNRTHYLDYEHGETEILTEQNTVSNHENIWRKYKLLYVIYDGTEYLLEIKNGSFKWDEYYYVGNFNLSSDKSFYSNMQPPEENDNVPFLIISSCLDSYNGAIFYQTFHEDESIEHSVEVYYVNPKVVQLDEKFIPDTIARVDHIHSWNTLTDKPFGEERGYSETEFSNTLTWSENVDDYESFYYEPWGSTFVKVSDLTPTLDEVSNSTITSNSDKVYSECFGYYQDDVICLEGGYYCIYIVHNDNAIMREVVFPTKGIYFLYYVDEYATSLTTPNYQFPKSVINVNTLDEKYIPDTIARKSDVAQSDWNETNETSSAYIKNKPFYEEEGYSNTLTWDGTTDGYDSFYCEDWGTTYVKLSDSAPTLDDLQSFSITYNVSNTVFTETDFNFVFDADNVITDTHYHLVYIVLADNTEYNGVIFPKKGVYVFVDCDGWYIANFTVNNFQFVTTIVKQIDEKFIPNTIARIEDIPEVKQADWNEPNINSKGEKIPLTDSDIVATWGVINGDGYTVLSVIYDGTEYILEMKCCTDYDHLFYNHYVWYVGNAYLYENLNTGADAKLPQDFIDYYGTDDVPFIYALSYHTVGSDTEKCVKFADGSDDHTLELYYIIPKVVPLDEKFIPDSVRTWDSLKEKPFYTEVSYDIIAEEQEVAFTVSSGLSTGYLQDSLGQLDGTAKYRVTYRGVEYWATVIQNSNGLKSLKFVNLGGVPITIDENGYIIIDSNYYNGNYTFKVEKERIVYHTLDEKFIPDTIARSADIAKPDWSINDATNSAYIFCTIKLGWFYC